MRLYVQRAFVCRECGETIIASELIDAERADARGGVVTGPQMLAAADKHYAETGHATYREENRVIYQPQP